MDDWKKRITVDPKQCGGWPCIREMWIRVIDVLGLMVAGLWKEGILEKMPDLESEDIEVTLRYARRRLDHPVMTALQFGSVRNCLRRSWRGSIGCTMISALVRLGCSGYGTQRMRMSSVPLRIRVSW